MSRDNAPGVIAPAEVNTGIADASIVTRGIIGICGNEYLSGNMMQVRDSGIRRNSANFPVPDVIHPGRLYFRPRKADLFKGTGVRYPLTVQGYDRQLPEQPAPCDQQQAEQAGKGKHAKTFDQPGK